MVEEIALRVSDLHKFFKLPHQKNTTLKAALINPFIGKKTFEYQHVLKGITFEVKQGEFFGIVGRNGGGKSTLLKLLAGIYSPNKGNVQVHGKLVPFIELGVGFNPELTGRDNVYLNGALLGFSDKEIDEMYDDIVAFAELERFMDQKLKNYSSGMQVRLAFSMATRSKADILLVDEVLAVGDASFQRKCYDYFSTLKAQKKTVIFISHDMNAVKQYCDKAILIDKGKIIKEGSANDIAEAYVRLFSVNNTLVADEQDAKDNRWGSEALKIIKKDIKVTKELITITQKVRANEKVHDHVFGFSIHSDDGQIILGTNTQFLKNKIPTLEIGEEISIDWHVPNVLKDGRYKVGLTIHGYGGLPIYDWWNEAISFVSEFNRTSPYYVTPSIELDIKTPKKN